MSEDRQKWTAFIAEIGENNTPCQRTGQKRTAFIAEIERTTHHVRGPTKVDSFHRGDKREQHTMSEKPTKEDSLSSRR
ncbi:hypothetical protein RRG08_002984 [Elysia crispata]|uniref:Uncharacterized protein n=1 Tax=Elysia crispata TaxID=231223 RepID=A0AAE1B2W3_9GAST|nr:hypothetical protein RRG08_002984 [Elysia crispata]